MKTKRNLMLFFAMIAMASIDTITAQVPSEMQYQVMVLNPTGGIRANENVNMAIELREGSQNGTLVWKRDSVFATNKNGICNLTLNFGKNINWANGNFYLATIIDGKESGIAKIMSVPYSIYASHAQTTDSIAGFATADVIKTMQDIEPSLLRMNNNICSLKSSLDNAYTQIATLTTMVANLSNTVALQATAIEDIKAQIKK